LCVSGGPSKVRFNEVGIGDKGIPSLGNAPESHQTLYRKP